MTDRETLLRRLDELVADIRSLDDVDAVREVVQYIDRVVTSVWPEPMPDEVAAAVEQRMQQLADAPGGRVVLDVGDLTEEELELIADSEIPPELHWNSDEGMPPHMIELFEDLADTRFDLAAVDAAAHVYAPAVKAAGGKYGHALAAVWRAWHREDEK